MGSTYYTIKHRIRFSECDPAGIVFYPQYFVMFNDCIEKWMDSMIDDVLRMEVEQTIVTTSLVTHKV